MNEDDDRRRHRRAVSAVPIEVDRDDTPPPITMPIAPFAGRPEYASIPPPIQAVLADMHRMQVDLAEGMQRVWGMRHADENIRRLAADLDRVDKLAHSIDVRTVLHETQINEFCVPGVKSAMMKVDHITTVLENCRTKIETFIEHELPRMSKAIETLETQVSSVATNTTLVDKLAEQREQVLQSRFASIAESTAKTAALIEQMMLRMRGLEDQNLTWKSKLSILAAGGGAGGIGALLQWLL